jgi:hypothetical protein
MNWEGLALLILAATGTASLLLSQVRDVLTKTAEVIHAWNGVRRALGGRRGARRRQPSTRD